MASVPTLLAQPIPPPMKHLLPGGRLPLPKPPEPARLSRLPGAARLAGARRSAQPARPRPARPAGPTRPARPARPARLARLARGTGPARLARGAEPAQLAQGTEPARPAREAEPARLAQAAEPAPPARPAEQRTSPNPLWPAGQRKLHSLPQPAGPHAARRRIAVGRWVLPNRPKQRWRQLWSVACGRRGGRGAASRHGGAEDPMRGAARVHDGIRRGRQNIFATRSDRASRRFPPFRTTIAASHDNSPEARLRSVRSRSCQPGFRYFVTANRRMPEDLAHVALQDCRSPSHPSTSDTEAHCRI